MASIAVGVAMFGGSVFLGQYFQVARGYSPTVAGPAHLPMVLGSMVELGRVGGRLISRTGRWKVFLVVGAVLMTAGFGALSTLDHETPMLLVVSSTSPCSAPGMGMVDAEPGARGAEHRRTPPTSGPRARRCRSSARSAARSASRCWASVLADRVAVLVREGLAAIGVDASGGAGGQGIGDLDALPAPVAEVVRAAYGDATGRIFLVAAVLAVIGLVAILAVREVPLRTQTGQQQLDAERAAAAAEAGASGTEASPRLPEPVGPAAR